MRFYISLLFVIIHQCFIQAQTTENDPEQLKKTKVLSITVMGAPLDEFGKAGAIQTKKEYRKYNTEGYLIQEIIYDAQSAIVSNTSFAYNKGLITKQLVKNAEGNTIKKQECQLNTLEKKESCEGLENMKTYTIRYSYDEVGNQIIRKKIMNDGTIDFDCSATFEQKNLSSETCKGNPEIRIEYQYDSLNRLISKNTFSNNKFSYNFTYNYNDKGQLTEEYKFDANNEQIERLSYEWLDEKLIKAITRYDRNKRIQLLWKYFYDGKNNIQYIKIYEGEKKTPLYQSEYLYKYYQ